MSNLLRCARAFVSSSVCERENTTNSGLQNWILLRNKCLRQKHGGLDAYLREQGGGIPVK